MLPQAGAVRERDRRFGGDGSTFWHIATDVRTAILRDCLSQI